MAFETVVPVVGARVGLVARAGLVGRGVVTEVGPDRVVVQTDVSGRLLFQPFSGAWSCRRLGRTAFVAIRFVREPEASVAIAPLRRVSFRTRRA